ncbi:MAG: 6-hydroxymethylpterin diphosphokinase MptE-like protein [Nitrososphaeria archaeon]
MDKLKFELYVYVINELGIDPAKDWKATLILNELLKNKPVKHVLDKASLLLKQRRALVVGAGPSVLDDLDYAKRKGILEGSTILAADGASLAYKDFAKKDPEIIVTDLDGYPEEEVKMVNEGSLAFVHAHGDNIDKLLKYVPQMKFVAGTTQTFETDLVKNYGGFTDGDRAAFIAESFGAKEIFLAGMDFNFSIGKYSNLEKFNGNYDRKRKKLEIGVKMLEALAAISKAPLINLSKGAVKIKGINNIER